MIEKGIILTIEGEVDRNENFTKARVQSTTAEGTITLPLTIPWYLRGSMGMLTKGTEVVYVVFNDATGVILSRMDGNWEGKMEETQLCIDLKEATATVQGSIDVSERITVEQSVINSIVSTTIETTAIETTAIETTSITSSGMQATTITVDTLKGSNITDSGVRLATHTHGGVESGESNTSSPNGGNTS